MTSGWPRRRCRCSTSGSLVADSTGIEIRYYCFVPLYGSSIYAKKLVINAMFGYNREMRALRYLPSNHVNGDAFFHNTSY